MNEQINATQQLQELLAMMDTNKELMANCQRMAENNAQLMEAANVSAEHLRAMQEELDSITKSLELLNS